MSWCTQVTDAAFEHLKGIKVLNIRRCNQATITDDAFEHLKCIRVLGMFVWNTKRIQAPKALVTCQCEL